MKTHFFTLLFLLCLSMNINAQHFSKENGELKVPSLLSDNMVLQQSSDVNIWGEAAPGANVTLTTSWNKNTYTAKSSTDGKWQMKVATPAATTNPQVITIKGNGKSIKLSNILIGEVWFGSGQSNMQMPMRGFDFCPLEGTNRDIAISGNNKLVRYATVKNIGSETPQEYSNSDGWKESNPENTPEFGATAYYFATLLSQTLNVPVGIINCSWGGSTVEGWLPKEIVAGYKDVKNDEKTPEYMKPWIMFNGMLNGSYKYSIKGFLWYQGESNVGHPDYAKRLSTMVNLWREMWKQGDLPFYQVEIAPFDYGNNIVGALLREEQFKAQSIINKCGMISTNDLVEPFEIHQIHPKEKQKVGERLAFMALNETYGLKKIGCRGPEYKSMEIKGNKAIIYFNNAENGFNRWSGFEGFEIAGADKKFYPAQASNDGKNLVVSAQEVQEPVAVRYCFKNFQIGNLTNLYQLPTVPFRTDNW